MERATCSSRFAQPSTSSCACNVFRPRRFLQLPSHRHRRHVTVTRAEGSQDSPEQAFQKELQKRGISGADQSSKASERATSSEKSPFSPPPFNAEKARSQLEESRKLNSEGLEGLLPRAKQLITLGLTFFLAFAPVILAISLLFSGIFWLYGDHFIHGGRPSFAPRVDPMELLNEPTVDPRIPYY